MLQQFKQHSTSEWPILAHDDPISCLPYPLKILILFLGRVLRRRQLAKDWRIDLTDAVLFYPLAILTLFLVHWSCDRWRQLVKDYYVVHSSPSITVMTRVGGNPESTLRFQTHVMSNLVHDELNDADGFWRRSQDHAFRLTPSIIRNKSWGQPGKHICFQTRFMSNLVHDEISELTSLMLFVLPAGDFDIVHWSCDSRRQLVKDSWIDLIDVATQPLRGV